VAILRPFRALRPPNEKAHLVASVPYDVVNTEEARRLAAGNALSLLHVSRPEIDLPPGTDLYDDEVYDKGKENLQRLIKEAPLAHEKEPSLYIYRQRMGNHSQTGVVGCIAVDEYDQDKVKKHEKTRKDKEDDRTRHIVTLQAQTGPVFLCYRPDANIDAMVAQITQGAPDVDFTAPDSVGHTLWRVKDPEPLSKAFARVPETYIADGHHRAASASRARAAMKAKNPNHTGAEDYNFFLSVLFPANQLQILPYNRVIKELPGMSASYLLSAVKEVFGAEPGASPTPPRKGLASMYLEGKWYSLDLERAVEGTMVISSKDEPRVPIMVVGPRDEGPISRLDVHLLQERLLRPFLDINDPRTDPRIDFVGGIRGTAELEKRVNSGSGAVAFSLYPTTVEDLMAIADAGEIMPPKSTWFEPKLRSGLVIHTF
jgi:uncharacterized protein (DUF1015 family)